jgi:hypothetical protein
MSRASDAVPGPPTTIRVTINDTSIDGYRHGEDQRAERLPDPVGDHLGLVHRRQHRAGQQRDDNHFHDRGRVASPAQGNRRDRQHRYHDLP